MSSNLTTSANLRGFTVKSTPQSSLVGELLSERELLEGLAEECSEAAQAALKLIRARGYSSNFTTTSEKDAVANLSEELTDICMVALALKILPTKKAIKKNPKWKRWIQRIESV